MEMHKTVLDEHARLDELLRDLRAVSRWSPELLENAQVRAKLAGDLLSLKVRLQEHFQTEESGSYKEEVCARKPSAESTLDALQAEHSVFLEQITSLESACRREEKASNFSYYPVLQKLSWLLDALKRHEHKENALIQEVFHHSV